MRRLFMATNHEMEEQYWTMCKIIRGENPIVLDFTVHKIAMLHACRVHQMTQGVNCQCEKEVGKDCGRRSLSGQNYNINYTI